MESDEVLLRRSNGEELRKVVAEEAAGVGDEIEAML